MDEKRLLIYWAHDQDRRCGKLGLLDLRRVFIYSVGAPDAPYVCDGSDEQVELWRVGISGGGMLLVDGQGLATMLEANRSRRPPNRYAYQAREVVTT